MSTATIERNISPKCLPKYGNARDISRGISELYLPPRRKKPSEAAAEYLQTEKGPYDIDIAPMMVEPMNMAASRDYRGIVLVAPARSSKSMSMVLGTFTYVVTCAPSDVLIIQMTRETAADYSRGDLARAIRESPELKNRLSLRVRDDATFSKHFRSGMSLKIGWPAISQLSSKTLQYVLLTDYDRYEQRDNVDGEGPVWDNAIKRTDTYMSRGKCIAESSPGEEMTDPNWRPSSDHEAPPVKGIMALYNRGTRARYYWPCLACGEYTEAKPGLELFNLPSKFEEIEKLVKEHDPAALAERFALIACKACGNVHTMDNRLEMNSRGLWVHEGQRIESGLIVGARRRTNIVSYWLGGVAATYQRWDDLLQKYFQAVLTYTRTGEEDSLKATTLTDQALPYVSRRLAKHRGPESLLDRLEKWPRGTVPRGVRFLTASIDVQAYGFVVYVLGFGAHRESWPIDRFKITTGKRLEADDRLASIDPAAYLEDWDMLISQVIEKKYPLAGNPQHLIGVTVTVCDSGGKEGVTARAYDFWRKLRRSNMGRLLLLVKGDGRLSIPRVAETWPDSNKDGGNVARKHARGDVPVFLLNSNLLKDGVAADLSRDKPGMGFCHYPDWFEREWFDELTAETRNEKGVWEEKASNRKNEHLDLTCYHNAAYLMLQADKIDWDNPPEWASDPEKRVVDSKPVDHSERLEKIAALARMLNGNG